MQTIGNSCQVYEYWLTTKSKLAQEKCVVRSTDHLDMTIAVDWEEQDSSPVVFYISDVAYSDGKTGDYLFLGNFVYTVSIVICSFLCLILQTYRTLVKSAYRKTYFLISQPKHMLWVLK